VRYDIKTDLFPNFRKNKAFHISNNIREWNHHKRLIKVKVPLSFLLEWFLKYFVPCISKDVATFKVFSKEDAIMRVKQLELIYPQSNMLYDILPDTPRSTFDQTKPKSRTHANGIVGSTKRNPTDQLSNQLQQLSLQ
jgi:hypothetical protein